jgi:hypothetical protein
VSKSIPTTIYDARHRASNLADLDDCGFTLVRAPLPENLDLTNAELIQQQYLPCLQDYFVHHLGATAVFPAPAATFVLRRSSTKRDDGVTVGSSIPEGLNTTVPADKGDYAAAIGSVHADLSRDCPGVTMMREMAAEHGYGRFAVYNTWQPLVAVKRWPLAVCDASTVAAADLVVRPIVQAGRPENNNSVMNCMPPTPGEPQRWWFYPDMQPGEMLVFRSWDEQAGSWQRNGVLHSAFDDPASCDSEPARVSLETRFACFWAATCSRKPGTVPGSQVTNSNL